MEEDALREGYGGTGGGCWATGVRSWFEGDGPVPGPLPAAAAAAGFGTAFGGKLIANKKKQTHGFPDIYNNKWASG